MKNSGMKPEDVVMMVEREIELLDDRDQLEFVAQLMRELEDYQDQIKVVMARHII